MRERQPRRQRQAAAAGGAGGDRSDGASGLIEGQALIFWDPARPGEKLDAIDTDQITPAADCVSESLESLDEKWKAGSFRHLMPDFRRRVHAGETFVIAGDRFAIGSSREMSPAGLKAVAQEAGLQLVVVCGNNMGDIFRRNSLNLGLQVIQSPEAVEDAQDGDELTIEELAAASKAGSVEALVLALTQTKAFRTRAPYVVSQEEN